MEKELQLFSETMIAAVEDEMKAVLRFSGSASKTFYNMMHFHLGWIDRNLNPLVAMSGKRIRPLFCLLSAEAAGGTWAHSVPGGASVELLHNFSLVHDDIQDASPTRRGRPTVWKLWGVNQAINSGDAMLAFAHLAMMRLAHFLPAEIVVSALKRLDETCIDLTIGQYADMSFENRDDVTVEEYIEMIGRKTAALLSFCTELGALTAACDEETKNHYAAFGRDVGLAFQVRDDVLGIWGKESIIGKSAATDIVTRKKSLPVLFGLSQSAEMRKLYKNEESDETFVTKVVSLLEKVRAREYAESREHAFTESAKAHLEAANPKGLAADALRQLSSLLLNRAF